MSFRILDQAPQYLLPDGRVNAGGSLSFYETDLTTPKTTWSDVDMTIANTNPVILDASGRTVTDVWGDGEYGVVCKDDLGVVLWTRNNVRDVANAGAVIPPLSAGEFLTNDGSVLVWQPIIQVPDMTGETGKVLGTDGFNAIWQSLPAPQTLDVVITSNSATFGSSDSASKLVIQRGNATAPVSAARTTSSAVTFPIAFTEIWHVSITSLQSAVGAYGIGATIAANGYTPGAASNGFTAVFNSADDGGGSGFAITNPVPFTWVAYGLISGS